MVVHIVRSSSFRGSIQHLILTSSCTRCIYGTQTYTHALTYKINLKIKLNNVKKLFTSALFKILKLSHGPVRRSVSKSTRSGLRIWTHSREPRSGKENNYFSLPSDFCVHKCRHIYNIHTCNNELSSPSSTSHVRLRTGKLELCFQTLPSADVIVSCGMKVHRGESERPACLWLFLTRVQWWWTSMVPSITWPSALIPERSVNTMVHPGDKHKLLVMA